MGVEIIRGESPNCHAHKCSIVCVCVCVCTCVFVGLANMKALMGRCAWTQGISPPHHKSSLSLRHVL
jgi:hypothetical protein